MVKNSPKTNKWLNENKLICAKISKYETHKAIIWVNLAKKAAQNGSRWIWVS